MTRMSRIEAINILLFCGIQEGKDYYLLSSEQTGMIKDEAVIWGYKKPKWSRHSTAWNFHRYVNRSLKKDD